MHRHKRRIATAVAAVPLALLLNVGAVGAFEPPGQEPEDLFSCNPSAVLGHPGGEGLTNAMTKSGKSAAWNAHFNSDRIGNC